ncbi:DsbA family protein [Azospirillum sp. TSO22-1]|uniref:DsbA family protein n=1 Tax=Azospirillum sp. TSO22-1 TaxID=716789 RepID=UPI000D60F5C4|nr:DsbA family protein [Azospirillum sp. TSO22-1]PWC56799.1 protein-disulfide isomerase [Azospirillum sp. TSO22-1]
MTPPKTLTYLFDPLCGWCYGASPVIATLADAQGVTLEMAPTGLFSGDGARPMDDRFAAYAWSNDQRIARLTGRHFTELYRTRVLADRRQMLDSGPATLALTAVSLSAPDREAEALSAIQAARYVDGRDVTALSTLTEVLTALGLVEAAALIAQAGAGLLAANRSRMDRARALMTEFRADGVPALVVDDGAKRWMLHASALFAAPDAQAVQLGAARLGAA